MADLFFEAVLKVEDVFRDWKGRTRHNKSLEMPRITNAKTIERRNTHCQATFEK